MPPDVHLDYEKIVRETATSIGYNNHAVGMNADDEEICEVKIIITQQSSEIAQGVDEGHGLHLEQGAGDQGLMFGFATDESESYEMLNGSYMPLPILLSHRLTLEMTNAMKDGVLEWARPDSKSQVTVEYGDDGEPIKIDTIVIAIQHDDLAGTKFNGDIKKNGNILILRLAIKLFLRSSLLNYYLIKRK